MGRVKEHRCALGTDNTLRAWYSKELHILRLDVFKELYVSALYMAVGYTYA